MTTITLEILDEKKRHIDPTTQRSYPDPDIPVKNAWEQMQEMLGKVGSGSTKNNSTDHRAVKSYFFWGMGIIFLSLLAYFLLRPITSESPLTITYLAGNSPRLDSLTGPIPVYINRNSLIEESSLPGGRLELDIKGGVYFKELPAVNSIQLIKMGKLAVQSASGNFFVSYDSVQQVATVKVQSGVVELSVNGGHTLLKAGETVRWEERSGLFSKTHGIDINAFGFATRIFEFEDTPLSKVCDVIGDAYGVTFEVENRKLLDCRITTRFDNKTLQEILDLIGYTLNFEYRINETNNKVILTGNGCE